MEPGNGHARMDQIWMYTLGLAAAVIYGQVPDPRTGVITARLKDTGNVLMFAEVAEISKAGSPASRSAWMRLLTERGISMPPEPGKAGSPHERKDSI
jgi:hypothetical protein